MLDERSSNGLTVREEGFGELLGIFLLMVSSETLNYFPGEMFNLHYWRRLGQVRLASISYG